MAHRDDKTWEQYAAEGTASFRDASFSIQRARESYDKWQRDLNSRTLVEFAIDVSQLAHQGTAQAGAATSITLAATASDQDDEYNFLDIRITGGTGVGQERTVSDYVGSTKVATVSAAWTTNPDATSTYAIAARKVHELNSGYGANLEAFNFCDNIASPTAGDRFFSWRAF